MKLVIDKKIIIGFIIFITILIFIVFRMKSRYKYPDTTAAAKTAATISGASGSGGTVTITTSAAHGYAVNDVLIYGSPVKAYIVASVPNTTTFTINTSDPASTFTANSTIKPAYKTLSDALDQCNINYQTGSTSYEGTTYTGANAVEQAFDACITAKTSDYVKSMCPWTTNNPTSGSLLTAYNTFLNDSAAIRSAYNGLINSITDAVGISAVNAARKADLTGATRKYLSTVCPGFYAPPAGGTDPGANGGEYQNWVQGSGAQANKTYYFDSSKVSFSDAATKTAAVNNIKKWAQFAASSTAGTASLLSGCSQYSATTGGTPNWKLAQAYGPGTVYSGITLPWTSASQTCTASWRVV